MRASSLRRSLLALLVGTAAFALPACSGRPGASVSGTVTLRGATLKNRVVLTFVGADNVPVSTRTDESGTYSLAGLPVGEVRVTVVSVPEGGPASRSFARPEGGAPAGRISHVPASPTEVPAEYGNAAQPLLRFNLEEGVNDLSIDIGAPGGVTEEPRPRPGAQ
jgi:hypothetical protein